MKTVFIWLLSAAIMAVLIATQAHGQLLPDAELDKLTQHDIDATRVHKGSLITELIQRANVAEMLEQQTRGRLTFTQDRLKVAQTTAAAVEKERDNAVAYGEQEHAGKLKAEKAKLVAEKGEATQKFLAWKWRIISGLIVAGNVAFFYFKKALQSVPVLGPLVSRVFL